MARHSLRFNKATEMKFRWMRNIDGVLFKIYIPQHIVPDPPPQKIDVILEPKAEALAGVRANIRTEIELVEEHTDTVRYAPIGDPETWQIGEPYIPKSELPTPWPDRLHIAVSWD